jgi:hypothetical protein
MLGQVNKYLLSSGQVRSVTVRLIHVRSCYISLVFISG